MKLELQVIGNKVFAPLKNKWLQLTPEEKLKQEFIVKLVNHYGYRLGQLDQDVQLKKKYKADIAIWKSQEDKNNHRIPTIIIAVECKAEHLKIKFDDYLKGYKSATEAKADFFIASNLKETKVYKVIKDFPYDYADVLKDIPNSTIISDANKIKSFINESKIFTREEFSKLLFRCHNIIRNNDKLSPEAAFDEISKILFMKIYYERNPDEEFVFTLEKFKRDEIKYEKNQRQVNINLHGPKADIPYMDYWFEQTKAYYQDDELFEENDKIKIKQASFESIVKELEKYNLSDTSHDVKGIAFEEFLGKTFRGELGQFFTPRTIVDFMVDILDPQEGESICDPACGSGGFLIKVFEYIRSKIEEEIQKEKHRLKKFSPHNKIGYASKNGEESNDKINELFAKLNAELDIKNKDGRLNKLSQGCIYGTDANPRMARTAKMNMIMHGDGHGGVHHHDGLLNVNGIFENRFDIVLTNPPFGSRVEKSLKITDEEKTNNSKKLNEYVTKYGTVYLEALKQVNDNVGKSILNLFELGKYSGLTEVLFMERCLKLLKKGGRMGIVLPEGVLNNANLEKIRNYFESRAKILFIVSIPQDVFIASGATVKPSLVFFKRFTENEENEYNEIKSAVEKEIISKYVNPLKLAQDDIDYLKEKFKMKRSKEEFKGKYKVLEGIKKQLEEQMQNEIKREIKKRFDYQIPVAEIEKAGITSTGAKCENELEPLEKEFSQYRRKKKLWKDNFKKVKYTFLENGQYVTLRSGESEEIYEK